MLRHQNVPQSSALKIKNLFNKNIKLRNKGKKIINKLYQSEWPANGIAALDMTELTNRLPFRALSMGTMGGMISLLSSSAIQNYILPFLADFLPFLQEKNVQENAFYFMILMMYVLGTAAATKLSYRVNLFVNPFSELNQLKQLHTEYRANCAELKRLRGPTLA